MDIFLREAKFSDKNFLFELRNQPSVYRYCLNNRPVGHKEHTFWLVQTLSPVQPETELFIINRGLLSLGQLRLDYKTRRMAEISVSVLENFRRQGVASQAIKYIIEKLKNQNKIKKLTATIHLKNFSSRILFQNLHFIEQERHFGMWCKFVLDIKTNTDNQ